MGLMKELVEKFVKGEEPPPAPSPGELAELGKLCKDQTALGWRMNLSDYKGRCTSIVMTYLLFIMEN